MPDAPVPTAAGVRVVDHAVLRVAAWPIEISDAFVAPTLASAARQVLTDRAAAALAGIEPATVAVMDQLADEIHAAVPLVTDQVTRRWLLAARRAVRTPTRLVPPLPPGALDAVIELTAGPALVASIEAIGTRRREAADRQAAFASELDAELRRARLALRSLASSSRFCAALALAEPSVLVRWESARGKELTNKARVRRLEATLLHFAMRACGRPTPNGGWSGIAPVLPDERSDSSTIGAGEAARSPEPVLSTAPAPRRAHVSVDLAVFATVLDRWARMLGADRSHRLRREPTLRDDPAGTDGPDDDDHRWVYLRRDTDPSTFATLATVPDLREALDWWPPGTASTPAAFYDHVGERRGRAIVEHLVASGVLHSALQLPSFADSPSKALAAVTPLLPGRLAEAWSDAIDAVLAGAALLTEAFLADDVTEVVRHRDAIHAAVDRLTESTGLGPAPDRGLVHLDLGVPWRATWTAAGRAAVASALADVFALHAADGAAEAYRTATHHRVRAVGDDDVLTGVASAAPDWVTPAPTVTTRADLLRAAGIDPEPSETRWTELLDGAASAGRAVQELALDPAPPGAGGIAGSFITGLTTSATWARWGRPQPGMFVTRFAALLGRGEVDDPGPVGDPVLTSLARTLRRIGARRIVGADATNPNAALRPMLDGVESWGWSLAGDVDDPSPARVGDVGGTAEVCDADGGWFVPVYDSAAVIGGRDPVSRFARTVAMAHGWELAAWGFPVLTGEVERWSSLPRLVAAASGRGAPTTVLSPRRWVVGGATLEAIRAEPVEAERYLAWRAEMDRRDVPARVIARWALLPDAPELILATESPLALRGLCERLPAGPATLVLSELPDPIDEWPVRSAEGHHLAELAVTWVRRTPPLDPAVFPGGVVPSTFGAVLDALDDADPAPARPDAPDDPLRLRQRARFAALLDELVEPPERAAVAKGAAAWLTRVADAQDAPGTEPERDPEPEPRASGPAGHPADRRLRADLRSLRRAFDDDIATIDAAEAPAEGDRPDPPTVRTQLVARLGHIDAVARWGEGADRLRDEATVWRSLSPG